MIVVVFLQLILRKDISNVLAKSTESPSEFEVLYSSVTVRFVDFIYLCLFGSFSIFVTVIYYWAFLQQSRDLSSL